MSTSPESVRNLLPEVDLIKQEDLRQSVISVWQDAIDLGGWTADDLADIPFTLLIPDCKFDLVTHTRVVTRTAVRIAETLIENYGAAVTIDMDILVAGGLLHEIKHGYD